MSQCKVDYVKRACVQVNHATPPNALKSLAMNAYKDSAVKGKEMDEKTQGHGEI